jgi:hypothetical protein
MVRDFVSWPASGFASNLHRAAVNDFPARLHSPLKPAYKIAILAQGYRLKFRLFKLQASNRCSTGAHKRTNAGCAAEIVSIDQFSAHRATNDADLVSRNFLRSAQTKRAPWSD